MTTEPTVPAPEGAAPADGNPGAVSLAPDSTRAEPPQPVYTAVEDWVIDQVLPTFRRTLGGEFRWCAQWWRHDEAVSRLTALWHAWEVLRLQPGTGMGVWYRDHLDHQLPILMGARGPFCQCSETAHREPRETVVEVAPGDVWDEDSGIQGGLTRSIRSTRTGEDRG